MRTKLILSLLSLSFLNTSFAAIICPTVEASAICKNGEWQVTIGNMKDKTWTRMSPDIEGQACTSNNEQTQNIKWNYAYQASRPGRVLCNYSLVDNAANEIGSIQIYAFDTVYQHTGDNWFKANYPGDWKCTAGQENCLFEKR